MRTRTMLMVGLACVAAVAASAEAATPVAGNSTSLTSLGTFATGTYRITAFGVVQLAGVGGGFDTGPNGVPVTPVTAAGYAYCNPNGCSVDVPGGGTVGPGGLLTNFGTLLGTLNALASSPADYFTIGNGAIITLSAPGSIFALVNDSFYPNNAGSYTVSVTAVPEPAPWALMIGGFALTGGAMRRRQKASVTIRYA